VNLKDIEQAIRDEKARIDAAHAAVAEAREALERAEKAQIETTLKAEARIVALEAAAQLFVETHEGTALHKRHESARVNDTMETTQQVRGQKLKSRHPFAKKARELFGSVAACAAELGYEPTTVRSWYATGSAARDVPENVKKRLSKKPYEIPESAWTPAKSRQ